MQVVKEEFNSTKTILSRPIGFEAVNITVDKSYKAGDIYPSNDNKAVGVILNDVDVESGDRMTVALLKKGYIDIRKLSSSQIPTAEVAKLMPMIVYEFGTLASSGI